jgi:UTP--glucose-1-phosphate uridylyltransferase
VQQIAISLRVTQAEVIPHYGCAAGSWQKILYIEYARQHLSIEGIADDLFLSILGMYVFQPKIFGVAELRYG